MRGSVVGIVALSTGCSLLVGTNDLDNAPEPTSGADAATSDASADGAVADARDEDGSTTPPGASYADVIASDKPVLWWRFGEKAAAPAKDSSGGGHDGTYLGSVSYGVPGAIHSDSDTAASFDGVGAYVQIPDAFDFADTSPFSVEAWIKPTVLDAKLRGIVAKTTDSDTGHQGWSLNVSSVYGIELARFRDDVNDNSGATLVPIGVFTHVVGTYDGMVIRMYVNGIATGETPSSRALLDHANPLTAARDGVDGFYPGALDEVALYDHALSIARVVAHYSAGAGK